MSFKRPLSVSPSPKQINCDETSGPSKDTVKIGVCGVCGEKASFINYGALSCQSCKTFFRRNGFNPKTDRLCAFNRSCEVNLKTRRNCTACRLTKCWSIGMSSDLIRKEEKTSKKYSSTAKSKTTEHVISKPLTVLTLNQSHKDHSLSDSEWTLISNIVHAYDTFSTIPQVHHIIESLSVLTDEMQFDEKNALSIVTLMYTSMQLFIRSSPDFQILTPNEQHSLFERNFHAVTVLCSVLVFRDAIIINNPKFIDIFTTVYGSEILLWEKRINKQLDLDSTIVKLVLIVLSFSSNCFIVDVHQNMLNDNLLYGTYRLLGSQNAYIDLLWKYMIYRHNYDESVIGFSRLIELFLRLIKYSAIAYMNNVTHRQLVDSVLEKTKHSLRTEPNKQAQLWGKI